ncbi:hypothetical protein DRJ17_06895, partial [Candidatus Woesearchaeota archaeon]
RSFVLFVLKYHIRIYKRFAYDKTYKRNKTYALAGRESVDRKTWSTRLDRETEKKVRDLIEKTGLKEAEVLRRLIIIGLKNVKEPADLLVI